MHIAHIAPLHEAVPPRLLGGAERVVPFLTGELVAMGRDVTALASSGSLTAAGLDAVRRRALRLDLDETQPCLRVPRHERGGMSSRRVLRA